ncbi:MAG: ribosome silencing factor [Burkholderiales bacterium]|nr:ribosome silencing factor [Phycisphaerae bacterium]
MISTKIRNKPATAGKTDAAGFAIDAARIAADTRCTNVVVLDVRGLSPVTDFFVLGTGTSARQMRTVAEEVEEHGRPLGQRPLSRSLDDHWILLDYVDVVVHLFSDDARMFYDLESLWGEAKRVTWRPESVKA